MNIKLLIVFLHLGLIAAGQDVAKPMSLRQCIDYALVNNTSIKNASIDEYIANSKVAEYKGTGLPQVTGTAAYQHADPVRRMFLEKKPSTAGFFIDPNNPTAPGPPDGTVVAVPNFFQLPTTADASVNINQLLFSSSFFVGLKAAKTYKELAQQNKERTKIEVVENVTKAYYMALINVERKNLFDVNITRVDSLLKQTKAMNKSGFAELLDVNRLEVTYNNLLTEKRNFDNMIGLSSILLKYQMNMGIDEPLYLSDQLSDVTIDSIASNNKQDYNNRVEYKLLTTQNKLSKLNYKSHKLSALPTLGLNVNVGSFTQSPDIYVDHDYNIYHKYATYSVALNVPIFSGFSRLKRVQQSRLSLEQSENNLKQFERTVDLQTRSASISFNNNVQSLQSQKKNMELAQEVARVTRIKYTSGVGSNLEVVEAESALKTAQINYYNSLYDAIVSKVEYDKSLGNLK